MQVTKSSQYCSLSFGQEAQSNASSSTTASSPQMSWIPRSSRPENRSWLSNYKITVQEETKPVLSVVDNPRGSRIAEARHASVSDEPDFSGSSVAETSIVQKEKQSEESPETAANILEETKFVLFIAGQSDFKIEKTRPVPVSDEFLYLEQDLDDISTLYKGDNFVEAKKKAIVMVKTLPDKPEAEKLIRYLNSVIFLCHVMQDMTFCHDLPANNSAEFIHWMLTIAEAARQESDDLPASSKLMLFCLRWAADAGDQGARQCLVKVLLFRQLCPDMPSPDVHFLPAEALEHLIDMAQNDTQLPLPRSPQEDIINRMAQLILAKSCNSITFYNKKYELIGFLAEAKDFPEIQLLIPFVFMNKAFGFSEYEKARAFLEKFHTSFDEEKNSRSSISDVYQFWKLMCAMNPHAHYEASSVEALNQLAKKGFLAAIHLLCELSITHKGILQEYIAPFIQFPKKHFSDYPSLVSKLNLAMFCIKATGLERGDAIDDGKQRYAEMEDQMVILSQKSAVQADPSIRDVVLYEGVRKAFNEESLSKIGRETIPTLDKGIFRILVNSQYTRDPAVLVYLHCAQVLEHGKGDDKLIETAEQKDALATYFHMLMVSDVTAAMDHSVLVNKLLDLPNNDVQNFLVWKMHPGFDLFIDRLIDCAELCRHQEKCYLLCLELCNLSDASLGNRIKILTSLAKEKILQDKPQAANNYYEQAWRLEDPSQRKEKPCIVQEGNYHVRRHRLPEYYQQLALINAKSTHPLEVQYRFNSLMSVWNKIQKSKDPSLWYAWAVQAYDLVSLSSWHVTPDMCHSLMESCGVAIKQQHILSLDLLNAVKKTLSNMMSSIKKSHHPTSVTELEQTEEALVKGYSRLFSEILSLDGMAKLPNMNSAHSYTEQHSVVVKIQAARSFDEIIRYIKELTTEHDFDLIAVVRHMALFWTESKPEESDDVFNILLFLCEKLKKDIDVVDSVFTSLECQRMWVLDDYCGNLSDKATPLVMNLIKTLEQQKTALFIQKPYLVIKYKESEFYNGDEDDLFSLLLILNASTDGPEKKFNLLLVRAFESYHPRVIIKLLNNVFTTSEQCLSKLEQLKIEHKQIEYLLQFFIYQIGDQQKEMISFIKKNMRKSTLDDDAKVMLLWCAYESSFITNKILDKQISYLLTSSKHRDLIGALTECGKYVERLDKHISSSSSTLHHKRYWNTVGFKLLSLGKLDAATDTWFKCQSAYPLAMLVWHHGLQPQGQTIDVGQKLLIAAKEGQVKAQCELVHWLLKRENDGENVDLLLKCKANRFVQMPNPMAGAESILYQGITQYLGFGCDPDLITGRQKIQEALTKDPLVVALRLYDLKEQGVFILPNDSTDYLWCYAQALSKRDKDPFNRRDNYFNNLLLNYGSEALQKLLVSLRNGAGSGPSGKAVYQKAARRLGEWLGQWRGATVSSASASRRTSKVTASTKASQKKSKGVESLANAPRKTSKVTVSPTKASQKTLKESACTEDDVDQVIDCATTGNWNSGALGKINQLTNRLRREKADLETVTKGGVEEKLHLLLTVMPVGTQELAKCADAVVDLISLPEKVTELILFWITQSKFAQNRDEKAFWLERILKCFPKDHSINLNDHKEEVLCFLELLIQHQLIPKEAEYLLDGLSADERAQLLLKGLPEGINANPKMYQQYVETVQSSDSTLIDNIWRALKSESDAALVRATFTALIRQKSSELHAIKADDGRLNGIDLYNLFSDSSTSDRETLLEDTFFALRELLVKSYLTFRKANPGKRLLPKHLESTIRKFVDGKQRSIKDSLDILIMTREHKVDDAALLQDYHRKIKEKALECMDRVEAGREQQNLRLTAWAILSLTS